MTSNTTHPTQSIVLVLAGMLILAVIDNTVRLISDTISLWQFHLMRSILALSLLGAYMAVRRIPLRAKRWWAVCIRSGGLAMAMVIYFGALGFLPIADAVAGLFAAPVVVVVITALFLPEKVGWVRWAAAFVGFAGTLMVLQPEVGGFSVLNAIPLIAAVFYALGSIATRELCEGETTISMLFAYLAMMGVIGALGLIWNTYIMPGGDGYLTRPWAASTDTVWVVLAVQAIGSLIGVACLMRAYIVGQASYVAVFEYSMLIFASVAGYLMFGDAIGGLAVVGMVLIIATGAVIAVRSQDCAAPEPGRRPDLSTTPSS